MSHWLVAITWQLAVVRWHSRGARPDAAFGRRERLDRWGGATKKGGKEGAERPAERERSVRVGSLARFGTSEQV